VELTASLLQRWGCVVPRLLPLLCLLPGVAADAAAAKTPREAPGGTIVFTGGGFSRDDIRQHIFGDFLKRTLLAEVRLGF